MPFFFARLIKLLISLENGMTMMVVLCPCITAGVINKMLFSASVGSMYMRCCAPSSLIIACMYSSCFADCYIALLSFSFCNAANDSAFISSVFGFLLLLCSPPSACFFLPYGFIRFPFLRKRCYS